jgi:DNA-directed RNA polymerase subunit L
MEPNINITDKKTKETLYFDIENMKSSFANGLRRTMLSEVPTIGFMTEDYINSSLRVLANTGSLHNEFLLHRLSLIPIHIKDPMSYNPDHYEFELKVNNNSINPLNVTSHDFKITNKLTNTVMKTDDFFPKNEITGDYILITRLKANTSGETGESIHIKGTAVKGTGSINALFSPVSCAIFTNTIDPKKLETAKKNYLENNNKEHKLTKDEIKVLSHKFMITESERHFYTDDNDEPNRFSFKLESIGVYQPHTILVMALDLLKKKLNAFVFDLNRNIENESKNETNVKIGKTTARMDAYDITIKNENHTLGNLLQDYLLTWGSDIVQYVGYMNPHPLENKIILRIKIKTDPSDTDIMIKDKIYEEIKDVVDKLSKVIDTMRVNITKELGGDLTK